MTFEDLSAARKKAGRVWFYRPELYWFGLKTFRPFKFGHDEYARYTAVFGWAFTGRIVVAFRDCGDPTCRAEAIGDLSFLAEIESELEAEKVAQ
jgi:hypothetical protein